MTEKQYVNTKSVILNEKFMGWHGSKPFVEFDENFVQMPLTRTKLQIPREHTTRMTYLSWWSGFIAGARGQSNLKMFLIVLIILAIIGVGATWFMASETTSNIGYINSSINTLRNDLLNYNLTLANTPVV